MNSILQNVSKKKSLSIFHSKLSNVYFQQPVKRALTFGDLHFRHGKSAPDPPLCTSIFEASNKGEGIKWAANYLRPFSGNVSTLERRMINGGRPLESILGRVPVY